MAVDTITMPTKGDTPGHSHETKVKVKQTKTVSFAPDVKFVTRETRTSHGKKRQPTCEYLGPNPSFNPADQLPAVVEKYMIRSHADISDLKHGSSDNIIYIDNIGMRYKDSVKRQSPSTKSCDLGAANKTDTFYQDDHTGHPPPDMVRQTTKTHFLKYKTKERVICYQANHCKDVALKTKDKETKSTRIHQKSSDKNNTCSKLSPGEEIKDTGKRHTPQLIDTGTGTQSSKRSHAAISNHGNSVTERSPDPTEKSDDSATEKLRSVAQTKKMNKHAQKNAKILHSRTK